MQDFDFQQYKQTQTTIVINKTLGRIGKRKIYVGDNYITNHDIIKWILEKMSKDDFSVAYRSLLKTKHEIPHPTDICCAAAYYYFFGYLHENASEKTRQKRWAFLDKYVSQPMLEKFFQESEFRDITMDISRRLVEETFKSISECVLIQEDGKRPRHVLDSEPYGYEVAENNGTKLAICRTSEENETRYHTAVIKGFGELCRKIGEENKPPNWYEHVINWYLTDREILLNKISTKRALRLIQNVCEQSDFAKEAFQDFYDRHGEIFQQAFIWFPEYKFVDEGYLIIHHSIYDLFEANNIVLQNEAVTQEIFPKGIGKTQTKERTGKGSRKPSIIDYSSLVADAIEKASLAIYGNVVTRKKPELDEYFVVDIIPETVKNRRVARTHGKFFAVVYYYEGKWWILVDSFKPESAIYLWRGDKKEIGLNLITKPKSYVKTQPGVFHRNHTLRTRSIFESYELVLSDAGGVDVLR